MARTYEQIKTEIQVAIRTYPTLNVFKFPEEGGSKFGFFNVIIATVAQSWLMLEILIDNAEAVLQDLADKTAPGNPKWIQNRMIEFQFGDVITFVDDVPAYNPVDVTHRIVTQCSVKTLASGTVAIKVAKGTAPALTPLSAPELSALKDYYFGTATTQGIGFAGVRAQFINLDADRMRIEANVYFYGQYVEATVKTAVIAAINSFLETFSTVAFDGTVFMEYLRDAIQAVPGVSRLQLISIKARANVITLPFATVIDIQGSYTTVAGYIISEDTAGNALTNTITMIPEPS